MAFPARNKLAFLVLSAAAVLAPACLSDSGADPDGLPDPAACAADDVRVTAMLVHDAREGSARDSAVVNLGASMALEQASDCAATVRVIVGTTEVTLVETGPGQFEAGYSEIVPDLPALALEPGAEHRLEIDLGPDGSVDVTGLVMLGEVSDFRVTRATASEAEFAWSDPGDVTNTIYYTQVSDQADFLFPDNFVSGFSEGATQVQFGGASEWPYFSGAEPPFFARIQAETEGTLTVDGRFTAWEWPIEPILAY